MIKSTGLSSFSVTNQNFQKKEEERGSHQVNTAVIILLQQPDLGQVTWTLQGCEETGHGLVDPDPYLMERLQDLGAKCDCSTN